MAGAAARRDGKYPELWHAAPPRARKYLDDVGDILAGIDSHAVAEITEFVWRSWWRGKTVFLVGNGGSAATASHLAWDLISGARLAGFNGTQVRALTDSATAITAVANDQGASRIFADQLRLHASSGDVLLCLSCSCRSPSILEAIAEARAAGLDVVGLGGFDGGKVQQECRAYVHVPSYDYGKIEAIHLAIGHCITAMLAERAMGYRRAVFVDRDGVIIRNRTDYVKNWDEVVLIPGSVDALVRLSQAGYRISVTTNQSAIARGLVSVDEVNEIHRRLSVIVEDAGGHIEEFIVCPHLPESNCLCRKPRPGMLVRAQVESGVRLDTSYLVGDHISDLHAADAVGCRGILVLSGRASADDALSEHVNSVVRDLSAAADLILGGNPVDCGVDKDGSSIAD